MRVKVLVMTLVLVSIIFAQTRTYRQVKDISARENGKVVTTQKKANLFEYTFKIDLKNKKVVRIRVRRLDAAKSSKDNKLYTITGTKQILESKHGRGGEAIIAIAKDGNEIIQLADDSAFTTRSSNFSQMITGIYKRVN